jgi:hypothetical protein
MGPGTTGTDFTHFLPVLDWLRQGLVLAHSQTGKGQGEKFVNDDRIGDYFYLCHGNKKPGTGIILVGQFNGPAMMVPVPEEKGWAARPFRWIKTAIQTKLFKGSKRDWSPSGQTTFIEITNKDLIEFEASILLPYFKMKLIDFGIDRPKTTQR